MPESSLITDDVRSLVGTATAPVRAQLSRRAVERAMDTFLGMRHPPAPEEGQRAPGYALAALEPEPERVELPNLMPNSLLISNEWQFERPLVVGEEISMVTRISDINERFGGRFGYSIYFRSDVEFSDASGALVARSVRTMMQYDAADAREGGEE
ncbi:MAG: MaoC family dehydratase N-terminal domain-containing protein [Chloroflexi bacterium]|nr:MaoC family dehydratase N-terminal domain-containing protein [Chloroflexota bacterium]